MTLGILASLMLVAANRFFVGAEFAITRIRTTQVVELEAARAPGANSLRHAVDHIDAYLAATQLGITVVFAVVSGRLWRSMGCSVTHFAELQPSLAELFREVVSP